MIQPVNMLASFIVILIVCVARATYTNVTDTITEVNVTHPISHHQEMMLLNSKSQTMKISNTFHLFQDSCVINGTGSCPQWSYCAYDKKCQCPRSSSDILNCDMLQNGNKTLLILDCTCVTYNSVQDLVEFGDCLYNCASLKNIASLAYHFMPANISEWNRHMCGYFKRSGTLCGKCDEDSSLYTRAYSFDMTCVQCTESKFEWLKYFIAAYFPLTVFCFIILLFRINIISSQLQGYVLYSQFLSISVLSRVFLTISQDKPVSQILKVLGTLYGVWNLDFFRMYYPGFCLQTGTLATLSLDFGVAVYPLILVAVTNALVRLYDKNCKPLVALWKPFHIFFGIFKKNWQFQTSLIDSFSTFFFLSNMKFISVCFDILVPVQVHQFTDARFVNHTWRLYYDATIPYFEGSHFYYSMLAILAFFLFVLLPVLILLLHPFRLCQQGINILLPGRWQVLLHTFVDSFQGCYKNGTEPGTIDCRWFPAVILIARFIVILMYGVSRNSVSFLLTSMAFVILALIVITVDPFRVHSLSSILAVYMLFSAIFHGFGTRLAEVAYKTPSATINLLYSVTVLVIMLPILYNTALILCWMIRHRKFGVQCIEFIRARKQGYINLTSTTST